jgi:hypothetical protein
LEKIFCLVDCGTDDAVHSAFIAEMESFEGLTCLSDSKTTNIKGVISQKRLNSFFAILDGFKFHAKFKKVPIH